MKWNIIIGTLVLGLGLCSQSFGYDLLDRMLGAKGCGCEAKAGCCETKSSCQKNGGRNGACQKNGDKGAACQKGGLLDGLLSRRGCGCDKGGKSGCSSKNGACQKDGCKNGNGACQKNGCKNGNGACQKDGCKDGSKACQKGGLLDGLMGRRGCGCDKGGKGGCSSKNGACQKDGCKNGNGSCQKDGSKACQKGGLLDGLLGRRGCGCDKGGKGGCSSKNGACQKDGCKNGNGACQKGGKGGCRTGLLDRIFACNRCCDSGKGKGDDCGKGGKSVAPSTVAPIKAEPPAPVVDPSAYLPSRRVVPVSTALIR